MADNKLIEKLCQRCNEQFANEPCEPSECALLAVVENAVEVVQGKWLYDSIKSPIFLICNKCGAAYRNFPTDSEYNFCPNCGAKMDGGV